MPSLSLDYLKPRFYLDNPWESEIVRDILSLIIHSGTRILTIAKFSHHQASGYNLNIFACPVCNTAKEKWLDWSG
jgi:hypothetical protein